MEEIILEYFIIFAVGFVWLCWFVYDAVTKKGVVKDYQVLLAGLVISAALYSGLKKIKPMTEFDACVNSFMSIPDFNHTSKTALAFRFSCTPSGG